MTHTYTTRTSVQRMAGRQPVEIIKRPGRQTTKIWTARLAFRNKTHYPLAVYLRPNVIPTGWTDGTAFFVGSPQPPTVTVARGQVGTWTGRVEGRGKDILPFCFQAVGYMADKPLECHPASVFLGRLPAPPLRLVLTVTGPRYAYVRGALVAYPGSHFSLARIEAPPQTISLPGKPRPKVETIKRPEAATSQGGFVP